MKGVLAVHLLVLSPVFLGIIVLAVPLWALGRLWERFVEVPNEPAR